jgi:nitrate reductase NapE component
VERRQACSSLSLVLSLAFHWGRLFILSYSSGVDLTLALGLAGGGFTFLRWLFQLDCAGVVGSTRALALGGGFTILCWLFQLDCAGVIGSTRALALGGSFGSAFRSWWDVRVDWLSGVLSNFARSATGMGHVLRIG